VQRRGRRAGSGRGGRSFCFSPSVLKCFPQTFMVSEGGVRRKGAGGGKEQRRACLHAQLVGGGVLGMVDEVGYHRREPLPPPPPPPQRHATAAPPAPPRRDSRAAAVAHAPALSRAPFAKPEVELQRALGPPGTLPNPRSALIPPRPHCEDVQRGAHTDS